MTYTTQCPNCQTRFKVNDSQLAAADGLVRCGRCSHVFKAPDHFVVTRPAPEPVPAAPQEDVEAFQRALSEAMQNRHISTPIGNPFDDPEPAPAPEPEVFGSRRRAEATHAEEVRPSRAEPEDEPLFTDADAVEEEAARAHKPAGPWLNGLLAALAAIGVLFLAAQLVYINRTRIAAEVPESRPTLESLCRALDCEVPWPTDIARIRTEWSELAFVPDYPNLIQLSATLKNHAQYPQAYPMLEVTLKDSDDQVLIRKVFAPKEYLKPDDLKLGRFNGNSEVKVTMRLDAGKVHAMGYSLYWFYP